MSLSGIRIFDSRPEPPSKEVLAELAECEISWIIDSLSFGLMDPGIRPVFSPVTRVAGPAATVRTTPGDFGPVPFAMNRAREGDVLVIDSGGALTRGILGDNFCAWCQGLGLAAVVIEGCARDWRGIERIQFPVFARGTSPRQPTIIGNGPGQINGTVSCGGVPVSAGDIVVADEQGVVVIPTYDLDLAMPLIREKAQQEKSFLQHTRENWPAMFQRMEQGYSKGKQAG
jgi:regulator of RNase E activity RraA